MVFVFEYIPIHETLDISGQGSRLYKLAMFIHEDLSAEV